MASAACSAVTSGRRPATRPEASSRKIPVGSPAPSRTTVPPGGSWLRRVTPAASRAAVFAHEAWPLLAVRKTG